MYSIWNECDTISHCSPLYEETLNSSAFLFPLVFPKSDKPEYNQRNYVKNTFFNKEIDLIDISSPKLT